MGAIKDPQVGKHFSGQLPRRYSLRAFHAQPISIHELDIAVGDGDHSSMTHSRGSHARFPNAASSLQAPKTRVRDGW